jgi:hypothetical protein
MKRYHKARPTLPSVDKIETGKKDYRTSLPRPSRVIDAKEDLNSKALADARREKGANANPKRRPLSFFEIGKEKK